MCWVCSDLQATPDKSLWQLRSLCPSCTIQGSEWRPEGSSMRPGTGWWTWLLYTGRSFRLTEPPFLHWVCLRMLGVCSRSPEQVPRGGCLKLRWLISLAGKNIWKENMGQCRHC